eukprot:TRINITY_DN11849_c0_g1_i1.p1 TRINITY_DN11849_c0_g1~~TRINITY_DN11849_c0_g1_i1.p1  ORF type:complete len:390 (+),score=30.38 TRINITY_DN11849_c0_g1_i1:138-1307(+)
MHNSITQVAVVTSHTERDLLVRRAVCCACHRWRVTNLDPDEIDGVVHYAILHIVDADRIPYETKLEIAVRHDDISVLVLERPGSYSSMISGGIHAILSPVEVLTESNYDVYLMHVYVRLAQGATMKEIAEVATKSGHVLVDVNPADRAAGQPLLTGRLRTPIVVPLPFVNSFLELARPELLSSIQRCFPRTRGRLETKSRVCVVTGVAGAGKTNVCLQFAKAAEENYDIIWLFNCSSLHTLLESWRAMATRLSVEVDDQSGLSPMLIARTHKVFKSMRSLCIFDDVSNWDTVEFVLPREGCDVLVTTRGENLLPVGFDSRQVNVTPFDASEASELFARVAGWRVELGHDVQAVLQRLGNCSPLQLVAAANIVRRRGLSAEGFIRRLDGT